MSKHLNKKNSPLEVGISGEGETSGRNKFVIFGENLGNF
jgi:hypothetical protein